MESKVGGPNSRFKVWYSHGRDDSFAFQASPDWAQLHICLIGIVEAGKAEGSTCSLTGFDTVRARSSESD